MKAYVEIRLSGSGGQGLMLAGAILAEAAGIFDGKEVIQNRSYGPESRGGASRSEIIISETRIHYPAVINPDIVLAMTNEAYQKYVSDLKPDGILVIDPTYVMLEDNNDPRVHMIPITKLAVETTGEALTANMVALGAVIGLSEVVTVTSMEKSIANRVPAGTVDKNLNAFKAGYERVRTENYVG